MQNLINFESFFVFQNQTYHSFELERIEQSCVRVCVMKHRVVSDVIQSTYRSGACRA